MQLNQRRSYNVFHPSICGVCRLCVDYMEAAREVLVGFEDAPSSEGAQSKFMVWAYIGQFRQSFEIFVKPS